jgi:1,4-dihydroxy-2-naphthoate octaprenyltransferase
MADIRTKLPHLVRLSRPRFLINGLLLNILGATFAWSYGYRPSLGAFLVGQACISSIQLMTHFFNEFYDFAGDKANRNATGWNGGSRVLVEGHFSPRFALGVGIALLLAALATHVVALHFLPQLGAATRVACVVLFGCWAYSAPPFKLHSRGLGELTVALIVTTLTPLYSLALQVGSWPRVESMLLPFGLMILPLAILQFTRILVLNIPDYAADREVGKKTLVVRLGIRRAIVLYCALQIVAYAAIPVLVRVGLAWLVAGTVAMSAPLGIAVGYFLLRRDWQDPGRLRRIPMLSSMQMVACVALAASGIVLSMATK